MTSLADATTLAELLEARGNPMKATRSKWLADFQTAPNNAAVPLAMSGRHPRAVGSYGSQVIEWAKRSQGVTPRWWQALAITRQLEHDKAGALVWREVIESGPRRIGKSVRLRISACWRCAHADLFHEPQLAMLVSKDLAVGKEIHSKSWRWAEAQKPAWKVTRLNGGQEITTPDPTDGSEPSRWLLRAPNAAYGYDVGYGQVDESWDVDPMAITDGLEPALLERHSPQLHLTSTAHARATSLMRRRLTVALRAADPDVLLLLWGASPAADFSKKATWRAASPYWTEDRQALIGRKYAAALAGQDEPEFDDPDPIRGWAAQYLNVWPLLIGSADTILPGWANLSAPQPSEADRVCRALGVAADVDQAWLSLGAVLDSDRPHLGSVLRVRASERHHFIAEAVRIQREHNCAIVVDKKGPASFLIDDLEDAGAWLRVVGVDDLVQACADLVSAVESESVEHGDYVDLNAAVAAAGWRKVGERRAFARWNGDISALEAVALAWLEAQQNEYDALDSIL